MAAQPIFSRDMGIFAHELLFRHCVGDECAIITDFDEATNSIIADGFSLFSQRLGQKDKVTINVGYDNIMSRNVQALPFDRVLLEIPKDAPISSDFLETIRELKVAGYQFLLDNYSRDSSGGRELVALADYVKVSVSGIDGKCVARIKQSLSGWNGKMVATRIESWEAYEGCKALGFDFFQGFFFSYPKDLVGRKLSSYQTARLNLLRLLSNEDVRLSKVVKAVSTDQALSIRLLHFVNSVACSLGSRVDSLERAAVLVGLNTLKKWAMTAVLSDLEPSDKSVELSCRAMHGASFLGMLAGKSSMDGYSGETLYLVGLLNNVDALMGIRMDEILKDMPLNAHVKNALLRDAQEPLTRYLWLLDAIYRNDWDVAQSLLRALDVPLPKAAQMYMQAGRDVGELMTSSLKPN